MKAKTIDKDDDPEIGELIEVDHEAVGGKARFLRGMCATGRGFALSVPLTMKTALQANAWTYGYEASASDFKPEIRT